MLVHGVLLIAKVTKFSYTRNYCDIIFFEEFDFSVMIYYDMLHSSTFNCKILLPKFNTCTLAQPERKSHGQQPLSNKKRRVSAADFCRHAVKPLPFKLYGDAIKA